MWEASGANNNVVMECENAWNCHAIMPIGPKLAQLFSLTVSMSCDCQVKCSPPSTLQVSNKSLGLAAFLGLQKEKNEAAILATLT